MLYHGSYTVVTQPQVDMSRAHLDFGRGFYATSYESQAKAWARRKAARLSARHTQASPIVNVYNAAELDERYRVLHFPENNEEWVEFGCSCRRGGDSYKDYDLIIGGVANDQVFAAVDMYYRGIWDMERTIRELTFYDRSDQYCFISQRAADELLAFIESYEVTADDRI